MRMNNPTPYKIECPYCGSFELFEDNQDQLFGTWQCPDCGGAFKPQPMPLDDYDKLWQGWQEEQASNG